MGSISPVFMALHPANGTLLLYVAYRMAHLQPQVRESPKIQQEISQQIAKAAA